MVSRKNPTSPSDKFIPSCRPTALSSSGVGSFALVMGDLLRGLIPERYAPVVSPARGCKHLVRMRAAAPPGAAARLMHRAGLRWGRRHEAGTGTHASGQLCTLG